MAALVGLFGAALDIEPGEVWAAPITIDTVPVGNPGNAPDQVWAHNNPFNLQFGSVAYDYRIGKYEVTNAQYAEFLNAKAASGDPLALYNTNMGSNSRGGITRSGSGTIPDPYVYAVKPNMGNKPVNYVSWFDAIRFVNWLHNGHGSGDTETGAYTLLGGTALPSNYDSITRNPDAKWWLPSEDEWYKAAYHQPSAQGGDTDDYWLYPTGSNDVPTIATADSVGDISNPGANVANYANGAIWNSVTGNVTTVGSAGPLSDSFYGTADQGGNVWEWNEALISGPFRGIRGGAFNFAAFDANGLRSSFRAGINPTIGDSNLGFRVATLAVVPEPSTAVMAMAGCAVLLCWRMRRR